MDLNLKLIKPKLQYFDMPTSRHKFVILFKQFLSFQAYTGQIFYTQSTTGLLLSAIGCALFITFKVILKSIFLRFKLQNYLNNFRSYYTWLPARTLNCADLIREFEAEEQEKADKKKAGVFILQTKFK